MILLENLFTPLQLRTLASIVQVGDAAYWECVNSQNALFNHRYLSSEKNRFGQNLCKCRVNLRVMTRLFHSGLENECSVITKLFRS